MAAPIRSIIFPSVLLFLCISVGIGAFNSDIDPSDNVAFHSGNQQSVQFGAAKPRRLVNLLIFIFNFKIKLKNKNKLNN